MRTIEMEDVYGKYRIEIKEEVAEIGTVIERLVVPCLLAAGFSEVSIEEYFVEQ